MVSRNSGLDTRGRAGPAPRTPTSPLKVEVKPVTGGLPRSCRESSPLWRAKYKLWPLPRPCAVLQTVQSPPLWDKGPGCVPVPWTPYLPRANGQRVLYGTSIDTNMKHCTCWLSVFEDWNS